MLKHIMLFALTAFLMINCSGKKKDVLDSQLSGKEETEAVVETPQTAETETENTGPDAESVIKPIYFHFDSYLLDNASRGTLAKIGNYLKDNPQIQIIIGGHCDERGSSEYNMALGQKRADEAMKYLKNLGISTRRIETVSWGEEKPAVTGSGEEPWQENRRDEFEVRNDG